MNKASSDNRKKRVGSDKKRGILFSLPALVAQFLFGWYPILLAFPIALMKYRLVLGSQWVGMDNFRAILDDPLTILSLKNTLFYAGLNIGLTFIIPIIISIFLMEMGPRTIRIMMILWFIPIASMASLVLWKWFYNIDYGLLNAILSGLGLPKLRWLNDPKLAMFCLVLPQIVMYGPGLIWIASLQTIPNSYYEAADLEGAGIWCKIWNITLPRLRPIISMLLILAVIGSFQVFDAPMVFTGGGPNNATLVSALFIYKLAFTRFEFGQGMAFAIILFSIIMALTVLQRKYFREDIDK